MASRRTSADMTLSYLIGTGGGDRSLYYDTIRLARHALYSRIPQRRIYAHRKLNELWDTQVELDERLLGGSSYILMSFGGLPPHVYVTQRRREHIGFEILPTPDEIEDWMRYL